MLITPLWLTGVWLMCHNTCATILQDCEWETCWIIKRLLLVMVHRHTSILMSVILNVDATMSYSTVHILKLEQRRASVKLHKAEVTEGAVILISLAQWFVGIWYADDVLNFKWDKKKTTLGVLNALSGVLLIVTFVKCLKEENWENLEFTQCSPCL